MEEKYNFRSGQHRLVIENREHTEITGVVHVDSFDDEEVIMETELGLLAVRGENLHIKHLNLDQGKYPLKATYWSWLTQRRSARGPAGRTCWRGFSNSGRFPCLFAGYPAVDRFFGSHGHGSDLCRGLRYLPITAHAVPALAGGLIGGCGLFILGRSRRCHHLLFVLPAPGRNTSLHLRRLDRGLYRIFLFLQRLFAAFLAERVWFSVSSRTVP